MQFLRLCFLKSLGNFCFYISFHSSVNLTFKVILLMFRFLADRFVEGTCPFCNYEVSSPKNLVFKLLVCLGHAREAVTCNATRVLRVTQESCALRSRKKVFKRGFRRFGPVCNSGLYPVIYYQITRAKTYNVLCAVHSTCLFTSCRMLVVISAILVGSSSTPLNWR